MPATAWPASIENGRKPKGHAGASARDCKIWPVAFKGRPRRWCSISAVEPLPEHFNAADFFVDRHVAEGRATRTAFRFAGRAITYGELADLVARAAGALAEAGLDVEQRVLLVLNDSPAFAAAF